MNLATKAKFGVLWIIIVKSHKQVLKTILLNLLKDEI